MKHVLWIAALLTCAIASADDVAPSKELLHAPTWVARTLSDAPLSSGATDRAFHTTYTLQRFGAQALITIVERTQPRGEQTGTWKETSRTQWVGDVSRQGAKTFINVSLGNATIPLACVTKSVPVAGARAKRVLNKHKGDGGCGDPGTWQPRATRSVSVLLCDDGETHTLAFAPSPGVEYGHVEHDCLVGGGYRSVAKDGSIAPIGGLL